MWINYYLSIHMDYEKPSQEAHLKMRFLFPMIIHVNASGKIAMYVYRCTKQTSHRAYSLVGISPVSSAFEMQIADICH